MKILTDKHPDYINSKALMRGKMIFTSLVGVNGKWIFIDDHLERLILGAHFLYPQFDWPSQKKTLKDLVDSISANPIGQTYLRLSLFDETLLVSTEPLVEAPFTLSITDAFARTTSSLKPSYLKLAQYALADLEVDRARELGFDDIVYFDFEDNVCEASTSNIFMVDQNKCVLTPPTSSVVLDGVLRKKIITHLSSKGVQCLERKLSRMDLLNAQEIWLTNSIKGLRKVSRWNQRILADEFKSLDQLINQFGRYGEKI